MGRNEASECLERSKKSIKYFLILAKVEPYPILFLCILFKLCNLKS